MREKNISTSLIVPKLDALSDTGVPRDVARRLPGLTLENVGTPIGDLTGNLPGHSLSDLSLALIANDRGAFVTDILTQTVDSYTHILTVEKPVSIPITPWNQLITAGLTILTSFAGLTTLRFGKSLLLAQNVLKNLWDLDITIHPSLLSNEGDQLRVNAFHQPSGETKLSAPRKVSAKPKLSAEAFIEDKPTVDIEPVNRTKKWTLLRYPKSEVKKAWREKVTELEYGYVVKRHVRLSDGSLAFVINRPDDPEKTNRILREEGEEYIETDQPVRFHYGPGHDVICFENALYERYEAAEYLNQAFKREKTGEIWRLKKSDLVANKLPAFIYLRNNSPLAVETLPDGAMVKYSDHHTGKAIDVIFKGTPYQFFPYPRQFKGWWYSRDRSGEAEPIRFRGTGGKLEIESWPRGKYRFPEKDPVFIKDHDGKVWEVLLTSSNGRYFIAKRGNQGEYQAFWDKNRRLIPIDLDFMTPALKIRKHLGDPVKTWNSLKPKGDIPFPKNYINIVIDASNTLPNLNHESVVLPYLQYDVNYGGHTISIQVPDFRDQSVVDAFFGFKEIDLERIHKILSSLPRPLLARVRILTIVPLGTASSYRSQYRPGKEVIIGYPCKPANIDGIPHRRLTETEREPLEYDIPRAFGNSFETDLPEKFKRHLEAAVITAIHLDNQAGWSNHQKDWRKILAAGFVNFEKAGPSIQQLILNLLLDPNWHRY